METSREAERQWSSWFYLLIINSMAFSLQILHQDWRELENPPVTPEIIVDVIWSPHSSRSSGEEKSLSARLLLVIDLPELLVILRGCSLSPHVMREISGVLRPVGSDQLGLSQPGHLTGCFSRWDIIGLPRHCSLSHLCTPSHSGWEWLGCSGHLTRGEGHHVQQRPRPAVCREYHNRG